MLPTSVMGGDVPDSDGSGPERRRAAVVASVFVVSGLFCVGVIVGMVSRQDPSAEFRWYPTPLVGTALLAPAAIGAVLLTIRFARARAGGGAIRWMLLLLFGAETLLVVAGCIAVSARLLTGDDSKRQLFGTDWGSIAFSAVCAVPPVVVGRRLLRTDRLTRGQVAAVAAGALVSVAVVVAIAVSGRADAKRQAFNERYPEGTIPASSSPPDPCGLLDAAAIADVAQSDVNAPHPSGPADGAFGKRLCFWFGDRGGILHLEIVTAASLAAAKTPLSSDLADALTGSPYLLNASPVPGVGDQALFAVSENEFGLSATLGVRVNSCVVVLNDYQLIYGSDEFLRRSLLRLTEDMLPRLQESCQR